jgi:riboflavin synthase
MKIYLAATAPGNETCRERGMLDIPTRLLSYYLIMNQIMTNDKVFETITKENRNENQQNRSAESPGKSQTRFIKS